MQAVGRSQIDGVIAFANIECSAVDLHAFDHFGDKYIGIGIAVAVRIRRQIVGHEVGADGEVLGDGFPVISGNAGGKILRCFYAAGSSFDGVSGDGDGCAGTTGIGIEQFLADKNFFSRVGREHVGFVYVGGDCDVLDPLRKLAHLDLELGIAGCLEGNRAGDGPESGSASFDNELAWRFDLHQKLALRS